MNFITKNPSKKSFTVINYNDEDCTFFKSLGFKEDIREFKGVVMDKFLTFRGSKSFGMWSDDEFQLIKDYTTERYGKFNIRKLSLVEQF